MKLSKRRVAVAGGAGVALLLVAAVALLARPSDALQLTEAERARIVTEIVGPGLVEGVSKVLELGFEQPGRIESVLAYEGQTVYPGQVLARLDPRIAQARFARAEAALRAAEARRQAAHRGARPEEIAAARAEADAARAQAEDTARDRARNEALARADAGATMDVDHARTGASVFSARELAARARLSALRNGAREELKQAADEEVHAAEAEVEEARAMLDQTELRAPIAGVVLRRHAEPGEQVTTSPQKPVVSMADVSRLRLRAEIDEQDVARVRLGDEGFAQAAAFGDQRFKGRVIRVMPSLGRKLVRNDDPLARSDTRVLEVLFELDAGAEVPVGMRMDVHVSARPLATPQS